MLSLYLYVLYDIYDICGYIWAGLLLPDGSLGSFRRRWTRCRKLRRPMCRCFSTLARTCSAVAAQCIRKIMDGGWIIMIMKYHTHHINIYINGYHIPWQWKKPFWSWAVETCWNSEHFRWCFKYVQIFQQFYTVLTYCNRLVSGLHMSPIVPSSHRPIVPSPLGSSALLWGHAGCAARSGFGTRRSCRKIRKIRRLRQVTWMWHKCGKNHLTSDTGILQSCRR